MVVPSWDNLDTVTSALYWIYWYEREAEEMNGEIIFTQVMQTHRFVEQTL